MDANSERRIGTRALYWAILVISVTLVFSVLLSREIVSFWLNFIEFGDLFLKPIYFGLLGGFILALIAFFRIDFKNRRSITWWFINLIAKIIRSRGSLERISPIWFDFDGFKMSLLSFFIWQLTKASVGAALLSNVIFGMAVEAIIMGWNPNLEMFPKIFSLPFITPPIDMSYARENLEPLIPALTLLIPPLLRSLLIRLALLVAATHIIRIIMPFVAAYLWDLEMPSLNRFMPAIQTLIAIFILWLTVDRFFAPFIDYNTRYQILGLMAGGLALIVFSALDKRAFSSDSNRVLKRRQIYIRILTLTLIGITFGTLIILNNSIADVRKVDMLGSYVAQMISVNRYLAELDAVKEAPYEFGLSSIPPDEIDEYIAQVEGLLEKVRLWDQQASFDKLRPEIGLIPYVDFAEVDILRFNGSLYWSASMDLILPQSVRPEDRWYAIHFVYTHVPNGFLMLDAHTGKIVDASRFFPQRRVYYGEGGLFQETWVAFPKDRVSSVEVEGYFYSGKGGVDVAPPLSWIFEPNFLLSYPTTVMRVLRYRDVFDRMRLLFPYFTYEFDRRQIDIWPVTDGKRTFWAMPLIVFLDAERVPWSDGNKFGRLAGYALIDVYDGDIQLIVIGDDFFSHLFKRAYREYVRTDVPEWLKNQLRYPEELFEWRVSMYNFFHVTDPAIFIAAKEFYLVPRGIDTYYIIAQPHGFNETEFVGILSLELRGALGENLAGYMVVRNDYPYTGEMIFYKVPLESKTKLLGPTAVNEALERNPDFTALKTLLREPRVGNQIFYRIGRYDVFIIPVYTAPGGGVVTQIGVIATVGADFTGEYYVGLGTTIKESFRLFLSKIAGVQAPPSKPEISEEEKISNIIRAVEDAGLNALKPAEIRPNVSFLVDSAKYVYSEDWADVQRCLNNFIKVCENYNAKRAFVWESDGKLNVGILVNVEGIIELHYVEIDLT
ncbi:MAG: UPF0182 family protein [Candidatus Bathyarchaeota archaeon]|nr:UPF0182 family protein [Candidatus Bathyarchaeota archaeon]